MDLVKFLAKIMQRSSLRLKGKKLKDFISSLEKEFYIEKRGLLRKIYFVYYNNPHHHKPFAQIEKGFIRELIPGQDYERVNEIYTYYYNSRNIH